MNGLIVLFSLEILLFALAFSMSGKDIMAPSVVMCAMFLVSTLVAILNAEKWEIRYSAAAVFLLSSGIFCFIMAEQVCRHVRVARGSGAAAGAARPPSPSYEARPWALNLIICFDVLVCVLDFLSIVESVGGDLSSGLSHVFALHRHRRTASLASGGAEEGSAILSQMIKVLLASGYLSSYLFVRNVAFRKGKRGEQAKHLAIMALSVVPSLMSSGRSAILRLLCAVVIEYYIVWHQRHGWHRNLSGRFVRYGVIALAAGIPVFYYSAKLLGRTPSAPVFDYVSAYLGASVQLFNLYVLRPVPRVIPGEESLYSVIKVLHFLGLSEASTSYNLEIRHLGGGASSNVYTFFRRPLHDFGVPGMYVFTILVAMLFSYIYYKKIKRGRGTIGWVLVYGYLFYWVVCSSILQYSEAYLSAGTAITLAFLLALSRLAVRRRPAAGDRPSRLAAAGPPGPKPRGQGSLAGQPSC